MKILSSGETTEEEFKIARILMTLETRGTLDLVTEHDFLIHQHGIAEVVIGTDFLYDTPDQYTIINPGQIELINTWNNNRILLKTTFVSQQG